MRVIAGAWRGKRLHVSAGDTTRPTADRVRQSIFDMLAHAPWGGPALLQGATVLDCFAGTGALGLEALSRGASHVWFVEQDRAALAALRANIRLCQAEAHVTVLAHAIQRIPTGHPCTLAFLDPPYQAGLIEPTIAILHQRARIGPSTILVLETAGANTALPPNVSLLASTQYGAARVAIGRLST